MNSRVFAQIFHQHILPPTVNSGIILFPKKYDVHLVIDV